MKNRIIKESARSIRGYHLTKRAMGIALGAIFLLTVITYVVSVLYSKAGSFTVTVNKFDSANYSIALSENQNLSQAVTNLSCPAIKEVTNISGYGLPLNKIGSVDGQDNGDNYLCYTFYLVNNGNLGVDVDYNIIIANTSANLDEAIRIMFIQSRGGAPRTIDVYAKANGVDDNHEKIPEIDRIGETIPFEDLYSVMSDKVSLFMPGEYIKYTVVMWIEGDDEHCTDDILGGSFKIDMKFEVSKVYDNESEQE